MKSVVCLAALVVVAFSFVLPRQQDESLSCTLCKIAVNASVSPLDDDVHTVEEEFDAECKKEFGSIPFLVKECVDYGNAELDPIIKELEGGTAPDDVCKKLNEC